MSDKPTHKLVKTPKVPGRYLSDYMEASERVRRTIIRDCKYPRIARVVQHSRAKLFITNMLRSSNASAAALKEEAERLSNMMADSDFDRDVLDHNSDFLAAYADAFDPASVPTAEFLDPPKGFEMALEGVEVNADIRLSVRRINKNNRIRTGLFTIRYAKNKPLKYEVGRWHSALLFGARKLIDSDDPDAPEHKLCMTLDAFSGEVIPAPTDAVSRFENMKAACASIAERWESIEPPEKANF